MKKLVILFILSFSLVRSGAQTVEDSVKAVINKMFAAMRSADKKSLVECFTETSLLQTITNDKSGTESVRSEDVGAFAESIGKLPKDSADERIVFDAIKIDGPLASVWTPYHFYYGGKLRHCGVNSFQVVRTNGQWRIQYIIDTRRRYDCE